VLIGFGVPDPRDGLIAHWFAHSDADGIPATNKSTPDAFLRASSDGPRRSFAAIEVTKPAYAITIGQFGLRA
jgi:hypothetical protein